MMRRAAQSVFWWLVDWIFPLAQPLTAAEQKAYDEWRAAQQHECEARAAGLGDDDSLAGYLDACNGALENERQRQQSVEARLTTIIGLSSIAGSIVFGTILTNNVQRPPGLLPWLIPLSLLYLTLQIASAMLAGVRGLERQGWRAVAAEDILPSADEARPHHLRRQIRQSFAILFQNQDRNNAKVTQMAVAHCAFKNFIGGLLLLAVLASVYHVGARPSDDLVDSLKNNRALRELLQGPQGQPGPPGPVSPPAPVVNAPGPPGSEPKQAPPQP